VGGDLLGARGREAVAGFCAKAASRKKGGTFKPEHNEFLLYPTYFHEHRTGIKPEFLPLLEAAEAAKPPAGTVRFTHFVSRRIGRRTSPMWKPALALDSLHAWMPDVVKQRFNYRAHRDCSC